MSLLKKKKQLCEIPLLMICKIFVYIGFMCKNIYMALRAKKHTLLQLMKDALQA